MVRRHVTASIALVSVDLRILSFLGATDQKIRHIVRASDMRTPTPGSSTHRSDLADSFAHQTDDPIGPWSILLRSLTPRVTLRLSIHDGGTLVGILADDFRT